MKTTIKLPAIIKIANNGDKAQSFQPYHENFMVSVPAGVAVEFEVSTVGQYFYYLKQAIGTLVITSISEFDGASETIIVIDLPSMVTLTNTSDVVKTFIPYREGFAVEIAAGDAVELEATTAGQVLYYLAQETEGLTSTQEAKH